MNNAEFLKYKPIVDRIVGGFLKKLPSNVTRDDLMSAGMEGLWAGLSKNVDKHENLEAYLHFKVRSAILDELRAQDWLPRRMRDRVEAGEANESVVFLDIAEWEDMTSQMPDQEEDIDQSREVQILISVLERLPPRERLILEAHYIRGVKFDDIAKQLGVSAPRISQIHARAMARVKELAA